MFSVMFFRQNGFRQKKLVNFFFVNKISPPKFFRQFLFRLPMIRLLHPKKFSQSTTALITKKTCSLSLRYFKTTILVRKATVAMSCHLRTYFSDRIVPMYPAKTVRPFHF